MAKNMYQKREERRNKKLDNSENQEVFHKTNINWYPGHMAKAKRLIKEKINLIDIVYEVIDARIPFSSKLRDIEEIIKGKKRILIMSKMDLCDRNETKKWVDFYEKKGFSVILVDLENNKNVNSIIKETEKIMTQENAKRIAKGLKPRKTRAIVMGIPNSGKSTLINRLVGKKAVNVGNKPGITKTIDWIRINNNIELLDTPGILWPKLETEEIAFNLASLTAIKEDILPIDEVFVYIIEKLRKYYPLILKERYTIENEDIIEIIEIIGRKRGCLEKGNMVDYEKVYKTVLNDMKSGLIKNITFDRLENDV